MHGEKVSDVVAHQQVEKLMKKLDKDQNGLISEQEFVQGKYS
jgi:Ca2+-binding EF-hand superfamily protein